MVAGSSERQWSGHDIDVHNGRVGPSQDVLALGHERTELNELGAVFDGQ
jgi:hypothetical protein